MITSDRYQHLLEVIREIKEGQKGTNAAMVKHGCGAPAQVSRWFLRPTIVAPANRTLAALRWACQQRDSNFLVPDWAALRYFYRLRLDPNHNPLPRSDLMTRFGLARSQVIQYFIAEATKHPREPKGPLALALLADLRPRSAAYYDGFAFCLDDDPSLTTDPARARTCEDWKKQAEPLYHAIEGGHKLKIPRWLRAIVD